MTRQAGVFVASYIFNQHVRQRILMLAGTSFADKKAQLVINSVFQKLGGDRDGSDNVQRCINNFIRAEKQDE